jgi:hypothetical protein
MQRRIPQRSNAYPPEAAPKATKAQPSTPKPSIAITLMKSLTAVTLVTLLLTKNALAEDAGYTPPGGSMERQAIMDVMRLDFYPGDAEAAHRNPKRILFKVTFLKVHGDWACTNVNPVDASGKQIAEPRWALLRRKSGRWEDAKYFNALRPFESDEAAETALDMNAATIRKVRTVFPDAPADIFPK